MVLHYNECSVWMRMLIQVMITVAVIRTLRMVMLAIAFGRHR